MKAIPQISESELEVLKILWDSGEATSSQIVDKLVQTTDWKPKTIQTLITRLVTKGAIKTDKINSKTFIYSPNVSEAEYKNHANKSFVERIYNGSISLMLTSFIKEQKLSRQDINELKKLLEDEEV